MSTSEARGLQAGAFLRLIRIWNLPTALADSFAGYLLAVGTEAGELSPVILLGAMGASAFIYSAGMAWNDILDYDRDKTLHPDRPLPSGAIPKKVAGPFALCLTLAGLAVGVLLGWRVFLLTLALIILMFSYNTWLKHQGFLGCLNMGACRFVNMWLGIAAAGAELDASLLPFPATLATYVAAVTLLSLLEDEAVGRGMFYLMVGVLLLVPVMLVADVLKGAVQKPEVWFALAPLAVLVAWIAAAAYPAGKKLSADSIGGVVRICLTGIILLDSAMLMARGKWREGALCAILVLPTLMLIKRLATRPRPMVTG